MATAGLHTNVLQAVMQHITAAIYPCGGGGEGVGEGRSAAFQPFISTYTSKPMMHTTVRQAVQSAAASADAVERLRALAATAQGEKRAAIRRWERGSLNSHFRAWRWVAVRESAWRRIVANRKAQRFVHLLQAKAFYGWRTAVKVSAGRDDGNNSSGQPSPTQSPSFGSSPAAAMRTGGGGGAGGNSKKSIAFAALPDASVGPTPFGGALAAQAKDQAQQRDDPDMSDSSAEDANDGEDDDPHDASGSFSGSPTGNKAKSGRGGGGGRLDVASKLKVAKQRYRSAEQASRQLRADRDRGQTILAAASDALERATSSLLSGRSTDFAVKASDLALNAQKLATGDLSAFIATNTTGLDDLRPPVPCKGQHVLLAWANFIIERVSGVNPRIGHMASSFTTGLHYAVLVSAVFPDSDLPARIKALQDIPERMEILVRELSKLVVDTHKMTHAAAIGRRHSLRRASSTNFMMGNSIRRMSISVGGTAALGGGGVNLGKQRPAGPFGGGGSRRSSASSSAPASPRFGASVDTMDDSGNDLESDVIALQDMGFSDTDLGTLGPLLSAGVRPGGPRQRLRGCPLHGAHVPLSELRRPPPPCGCTMGTCRWTLGWTRCKKAERHSRALDLLVASVKSWQLLLELVEDAAVGTLYRLAKGERAGALFADIRTDSALSRFLIPVTAEVQHFKMPAPDAVEDPDSGEGDNDDDSDPKDPSSISTGGEAPLIELSSTAAGKKPGGKKAADGAKGTKPGAKKSGSKLGKKDEAPLPPVEVEKPFQDLDEEVDERQADLQRIHAQLTTLIPDERYRKELIQGTHLAGDSIYGLFSHFAPSSPMMPPTGLETMIIDCKLVEQGVVARGTGLQLARQHGKAGQGGLSPMEFVVALVHLSEMATPSLFGRTAAALKTYATPASRFDYFITQFIQAKVRLTAADAVRRLMQGGAVSATMSTYSKMLQTLFGSAAGAAAARAATAAKANGHHNLAQPPSDFDELSLQLEDWTKLAKDLELIDALTPLKFVQTIFANSQDSFDATGDADMSYTEFEEAMVALALARVANPYMSIAVRLHVFFGERLVPSAAPQNAGGVPPHWIHELTSGDPPPHQTVASCRVVNTLQCQHDHGILGCSKWF